jgi:hypothetical protein
MTAEEFLALSPGLTDAVLIRDYVLHPDRGDILLTAIEGWK